MRAATLSIGDELVLGLVADTNAPWLARQLAAVGIVVGEHRVIGDDRAALRATIEQLAGNHDLLVLTGGLGPTADDLTRHALGDVVVPGQPLTTDPIGLAHLEGRFTGRGQPMPRSNLVQAQRPSTMSFLPNPHGTAMGLAGFVGSCRLFALPGPPAEMQPMFQDHVLPTIRSAGGGDVLLMAAVHSFGLGEAAAAERLGPLMDRDRTPLVGTTVSHSIVSARVRGTGPSAAVKPQLGATVRDIERRWHPYAYGRDGDSLPMVVGRLLRERRATLVTAESCTGGLLGSMIVSVSGASDYYLGGWVTYGDTMKALQLGVPVNLLNRHGAVSEPVAASMALGALHRCAASHPADFSLAITGIAGPDGGSASKPVGTVFVAVGRRINSAIVAVVRHFLFTGDRDQVRDRAAKSALQMLRWTLMNVGDDLLLLWERPREPESEPGSAGATPIMAEPDALTAQYPRTA